MKPEVLKYLEDIRLSIKAIERYIADIETANDYGHDQKTIDSVERRLAIIGEALFKANKIDTNLAISDKYKIIRLRHILVHEYDLITHSTIWEIIHNSLPILKQEVQSLLH